MNAHSDDAYLYYMESRSGCYDEDLSETEAPEARMSLQRLAFWSCVGGGAWWFLIRMGIFVWRWL